MVLDDTLKNYFSSAAGASADHTTALRAPPQRGGYDEYPEILEGLAAGEESRSDGTGRVHGRAGEPDAHEVDEDEGQTDRETCEIAGTYLAVSRSEDHEHEEERGDELNEERSACSAGVGHRVGSETSGEVRSGDYFCEKEEDRAGDDGSDDLADPVAKSVLPAHSAGKGGTEGDGRVDVAAGDASDGVGHSHYRETEGDSRADHSGGGVAAEEHCRSAAKKCQNHCSDALGDVLSHNINN